MDTDLDRSLADESYQWPDAGDSVVLQLGDLRVTWRASRMMSSVPPDMRTGFVRLNPLRKPPHSKRPEVLTVRIDEATRQAWDRLLRADDGRRKEKLPEVIAAATAAAAAADAAGGGNAAELRLVATESLYRKARALAYVELPDVRDGFTEQERAAYSAAFEETLAELRGRAGDAFGDDPAYELLLIRSLRRQGKFAEAALRTFRDEGDPARRFWRLKKRRDLLRELGWNAWAENATLRLHKTWPWWAASVDCGL